MKHKYTPTQRTDFYNKLLGCKPSPHGVTEGLYPHAEFRYRSRSLVKLSDDLIAAGHDCIVMRPDVRYVYQLEACGLRYIGQTKDPLQRYECHLCKDESASVLVVTAAIDNNVAPTMTVLDITDQMSALVVEAFWINRLTCVNKTCSESQYKKWLKDSSKYNCVIAKIQPNH